MARARSKAILGPRQSIGINIGGDLKGALDKFEKHIKTQVLRSGARAGALVFYNEMRLKVPVDTGTLYGSIYHWHDDEQSTENRQVYAIGPNKRKAPHWHNVEYGHWRVNPWIPGVGWANLKLYPELRLKIPVWTPAKPYIRPAWSRVNDALQAAIARMKVRMTEVGDDTGAAA